MLGSGVPTDRPISSRPSRLREPARITIHSVAEHAQVAISTVSRVVNGGRASAGVTRRVEKAIAELGYRPSLMAQSLVTRKAGCIGLVVNSCQSAWFTQILVGVEHAIAPSRNSVLLGSLSLNGSYDSSAVIDWIHDRRVDGLLLVRGSSRDDDILQTATDAGVPIVLLAPDIDQLPNISVRCNNLNAGRIAATHLLELGHRHFSYAGGPQESLDSRMRLIGIKEALQQSESRLSEADIHFGESYDHQTGEQHARNYLSLPQSKRPSAVILGNDSLALSFLRTVLAAGVRVPQELSVVGFDGTPEGQRFWPSLTTVQQPTEAMAIHACTALLQIIANPSDSPPTSTEFRVELVVRESTGVPSQ